MFAYCLNNPVICGDSQGNDAILVIDKQGAGSFGHVNLLVQSEDERWHYFSFASSNIGILTVGKNIIGVTTDAEITYKSLGFQGCYDIHEFDGLQTFLKNSGVVDQTAKNMDVAIHLTGDFSEAYTFAIKDYRNQKSISDGDQLIQYNAFRYNCMHYALDALKEGSLSNSQRNILNNIYQNWWPNANITKLKSLGIAKQRKPKVKLYLIL